MIARTFIYDNGAAMMYKGYHFAIRRLCKHLHEHYRKHGSNGYILLFDFSKFFDSISHALCEKIIAGEFSDERIIRLVYHFIDAFGEVGLDLGSQISQTLALASANRLDHYIKEACRVRGYGRYMDDGYLIHESKEYLQKYLSEIQRICEELGIRLNIKKTQIVKLSHGFTWLKTRFFLTENGSVVRKIYHRSVTKMRRKLKTLKVMVENGKMTYADVYASWQSWRTYARHFNAYHTIRSMGTLYNRLFLLTESIEEAR